MNKKSDLSKIKLVALDLDGTLLDPKSEVNEACKEAIRSADRAGIELPERNDHEARERIERGGLCVD